MLGMRNKYKFSIIIPTYNRSHFLPMTLESVSNQTYQEEYEIIVVDDGSTDNTEEILKKWIKKEPRLKVVKHKTNKGAASARNTGISIAKGKYILFLDSDDRLLPEALKIFAEAVKNQSNKEVFIGATLKENKIGKIKKVTIPNITENKMFNLKNFIDGKFSGCLYLVKKEILNYWPFPENLKVREDFVARGWWIALYKVFPIKNAVGIIKDHPDRLRYKTEFYLKEALASVDLLFQKLPQEFQKLYPYAKAKAYIEIGGKLYQIGNYKTAFKYFNQAIKTYPKNFLSFRFFKKYLKVYIKSFISNF